MAAHWHSGAVMQARASHYVRAFPNIAGLQLANARVDLRYQAGLALRAEMRVAPAKLPAGTGKKTTKKVTTKS